MLRQTSRIIEPLSSMSNLSLVKYLKMQLQVLVKSIPHNIIALNPDIDQNYKITPRPFKKDPPQILEPNLIRTSTSSNTFTAREAGLYS